MFYNRFSTAILAGSFSVFLHNPTPETTGRYLPHLCFQCSVFIQSDDPGTSGVEPGHGSGEVGEFPFFGFSLAQVCGDLDRFMSP